jgi:hypothetical protein
VGSVALVSGGTGDLTAGVEDSDVLDEEILFGFDMSLPLLTF